jgi:glucosylceramidase
MARLRLGLFGAAVLLASVFAILATGCTNADGACGTAAISCPIDQLACGQQCERVLTDPLNCGGCGIPCSTGEICSGGVCRCVPGVDRACPDAPTGGPTERSLKLVTSAPGAYWTTNEQAVEVDEGKLDLTVDDTSLAQVWEGFGGAFNELGWSYLSVLSPADRDAAIQLLYGQDGARFAFGRIPIGASDYALDRYTLEELPADGTVPVFSIERDRQLLIPFVKAARAVKGNIRFWASPWTPPTWMKEGPFQSGNVVSPFDGGTMKSDAVTLDAFARYLLGFVNAYAQEGISIEAISPQNEPSYSGNYPTCLWTPTTYTTFLGQHLGPAFEAAGLRTKILLGTFNGGGSDPTIVTSVMRDAAASRYVKALGFQWGMLSSVAGSRSYNLPIWQTEHKAGNYPWLKPFTATSAPNDDAFAVESWGLIRDWIKAGATAYSAWNMVLDTAGIGIDTTRVWPQDALLTVDTISKTLNITPTYYVFRHLSQFVETGARIAATNSGEALAFKNPDGTVVVVLHNAGAAKTMTISVGGRRLRFPMPARGWATVIAPP